MSTHNAHQATNSEALRESERRYRRLFESAKDGILILDAATGMVVDVNPFLIELLGLSRESFLARKVWELGFFKDIAANEAKFAELQARQYVRYENLPLETADGRNVSVEFVSNVYLVDRHKVIQCNIRDISARKRAEESVNLFRQLLDQSSDGIEVIDPETGRFLDINETTCKRLGYSREEMLSMSVPDISGAFGNKQLWRKNIEEIKNTGFRNIEDSMRRKDGSHIPVEIHVRYIKLDRDYMVAMVRDITERKVTEKRQRLQSGALEAAASSPTARE